MPPSDWNDAFLDRMRQVGDEPADRAIRALFDLPLDGTAWVTTHRLLNSLVDNDATPRDGLPPELIEYLDSTARVPAPLLPQIQAGENLFACLGPEILMLLGCYSLPAAYSAAKGAQVLCRTRFLEDAASLRLFQTAQMIVDVMSPGGLGPRGTGIRAAQKVRLLHAAIRHLILVDTKNPWNSSELGIPINQEDLAGTLMTFSTVILEGLASLEIVVPPEQQQAYFDAWRAVGRLMGVEEALIPANFEEGRQLTDLIHRRQVASSPEGIRLTKDLLKAMSEGPFPPPVVAASTAGDTHASWLERGWTGFEQLVEGEVHHGLERLSAVLMRHLLKGECDRNGRSVADILELPPTPAYAEAMLTVAVKVGAGIEAELNTSARRRRVLRWFNLLLIDWMLSKTLGSGRALFSVPATLYASWKQTAIT